MKVKVIGAGLAGCEAALQLANRGIEVELYDMKPHKKSPAHHKETFAELVCSNSLKSEQLDSSSGMLKAEIRKFDSVILKAAEKHKVPAGGALAVNRDLFSEEITAIVRSHPKIEIKEEEVKTIQKDEYTIIATGPLTSQGLIEEIKALTGEGQLNFFDAAAPIIEGDSIDQSKAFPGARYGKGTADYLNCPFEKEEYEAFHQALVEGEIVEQKEFEKEAFRVYEGCMPVEIMGKRGVDTLRFGPMRPVGIYHPETDKRPWAIVQLRKENKEGTMYNMVGFQTNLKFGEQERIFSMIPGLEKATFLRYGVMHRNTFIQSPKLLKRTLNLKSNPKIYFAGQITGVEGYVESAMTGIVAGYNCYQDIVGKEGLNLSSMCMMGAILGYITDETVVNFQPMASNMGLLPPLEERIKNKRERYLKLYERGQEYFNKIEI